MHPGFSPKNHPNQVKKRGADDSIDDRETPPCVYVPLDADYRFTLDAAASHANRKCVRYCTLDGLFMRLSDGSHAKLEDGTGLTVSWKGERVWCNPPFSGLRLWVERAWDEPAEVAVCLLPNNRSEQPWWQRYVEPFRDRPGSILVTRHLPKRRPFLISGEGIGNRTSKNPPFGLVVLIWDRRPPARPGVAL